MIDVGPDGKLRYLAPIITKTQEEIEAMITPDDYKKLDNIFMYHAPKEDQPKRYEIIRSDAKRIAMVIMDLCPESRERSLALTKLEEAIMWANASIARNE